MPRSGSLSCIGTFRRIVRRMRVGVTVTEIAAQEGFSRRNAARWIALIQKIFKVQKFVGDRVTDRWVYSVDREQVREWF